MEVTKTLQPGEMGTKRYLNKYGDRLICVRYRIDKLQRKRYTTIEVVTDERPYLTTRSSVFVWVKLLYKETGLREKARENGARWLPDKKVWEMTYEEAKKAGLKKQIIKRMVK